MGAWGNGKRVARIGRAVVVTMIVAGSALAVGCPACREAAAGEGTARTLVGLPGEAGESAATDEARRTNRVVLLMAMTPVALASIGGAAMTRWTRERRLGDPDFLALARPK